MIIDDPTASVFGYISLFDYRLINYIAIEGCQVINQWSTKISRPFKYDPDFLEINWIVESISRTYMLETIKFFESRLVM